MSVNPFSDVVVRDLCSSLADAAEVHASARELLLHNLEAAAQGGRPRWVVLLGEPGLGKSHLLAWLRTLTRRVVPVPPPRERSRLFRHLLSATERSGMALDLALEMLRPELRDWLGDPLPDARFPYALKELVRLAGGPPPERLDFPGRQALRALSGAIADAVAGEQEAHDVLTALLASARAPVIYAFDQMESIAHWCGDEGLRALFTAVMDLYHVRSPLLLVVACQAQEWPRISEIAGEAALQRVDAVHALSRLRPEEAIALVRARLHGELGPFRERELRALCDDPVYRSPRMLLRRLAVLWEEEALPGPPTLEQALQAALASQRGTERDAKAAAALRKLLERGAVPGLSATEVDDRSFDLLVAGSRRLRVAVLCEEDGRALVRHLGRLRASVEEGAADAGLVLRETTLPIPERAQRALDHVQALEGRGGGLVGVAPSALDHLAALVEVVDLATAGDLDTDADAVWNHALAERQEWLAALDTLADAVTPSRRRRRLARVPAGS
jgi:hypothetical protein